MDIHCSICSQLKDTEYAMQKYGSEEYNTYLPKEVWQLETIVNLNPGSSRECKLLQCPECKTYYLFDTDYEYLVNGTEDEQTLKRLTHDEALKYIQ